MLFNYLLKDISQLICILIKSMYINFMVYCGNLLSVISGGEIYAKVLRKTFMCFYW